MRFVSIAKLHNSVKLAIRRAVVVLAVAHGLPFHSPRVEWISVMAMNFVR